MKKNAATDVSSELTEKNNTNQKSVWGYILRFLQGILIGTSAILPGISGGVMCVIFGIYQPLMQFLAHPIRNARKHIGLLLPIIFGVIVGFVGLSGIIAKLAEKNEVIVTSAFVGLILGMFPSLFVDARKRGNGRSSTISLVVSTVLLLGLFLVLKLCNAINIEPSILAFLFCGVLWGISMIAPGMSSSSTLLFLGLYYPLTDGISNLNFAVVLPFLVGMLASLLLLVRLVNHMLEHHEGIVYNVILGFVIASTIPIIPLSFASTTELILSILFAAICFCITFFMDVFGKRLESK